MDKKEEKSGKKKLSKIQLRTIIVASIAFAVALSLIITNVFIPVKYLSSYIVIRNKGADAGVMRVRFVDVGYGDCTVIELPDGKNMLIDGGNGSASNQSRILKYLNSCDIDVIDYLVCTSVSAEHCGGLSEIMKFKTVKTVFMPYCLNSYITDAFRKFTLSANKSGDELKISEYGEFVVNAEHGYSFKILSPSVHSNPMGEYEQLIQNPTSQYAIDNSSAVVWLEYAETSFLFAGDVRDSVLEGICNSYDLLLDEYPAELENCNILKVPNHGNEFSSCSRLYELLKPELAVISVGENGDGCPSQTVLSNAAKYVGDNLYRTDVHGTVTIQVTSDGYKVV